MQIDLYASTAKSFKKQVLDNCCWINMIIATADNIEVLIRVAVDAYWSAAARPHQYHAAGLGNRQLQYCQFMRTSCCE